MRASYLLPAMLVSLPAVANAPGPDPGRPPGTEAPVDPPGAPVDAPGLPAPRPEALQAALDAHACATARGTLDGADHPDRLVVIDFSLPSTARRLWVMDVPTGEVLLHEHVAHGQGTGDDLARVFSNVDGSHQSSLGVFLTAETYTGKHGRSLKLDGLEPGVNDRARARAIVIHAADYVSDAFIEKNGRLGRSWGCPAVHDDVLDPLLDHVAGGTLLVAWYPDAAWLERSTWLSCTPS